MLYKKKRDMIPIPIEHCTGGGGTVMMERLLDAPEEMSDKDCAYMRHTLKSGVTIRNYTHEHGMEAMTVLSDHARHVVDGEEQFLELGDIIGAISGNTHEIACVGDEDLVVTAQVLCE